MNLRTAVLALSAASLAIVWAQSGGLYGPGQTWWNAGQGGLLPWEENYNNPDGQLGIVNKTGAISIKDHPFFQALGSNGRACVTCHQPANAMSVSTATLQERWEETLGSDPVFAAIDGSNCPDLPQDARTSHSLLLERGLFRIALPWPPLARWTMEPIIPEIKIELVRDPTGCNSSTTYGLKSSHPQISVYRRPRMAANLDGVMTLMADGREPSLRSQAITAVFVHEQATNHPTADQLEKIVAFESQIYAAQRSDIRGGLFDQPEGRPLLGPRRLANGSAGTLGLVPANALLRSFDSWKAASADRSLPAQFRASVAGGSKVFRDRCARCHESAQQRWLDIGATAADSPDLPRFRVTCLSTGQVTYTQDPGRALITGRCEDVGAIVVPQFRGLAARAPYFSNGSAQRLSDLVEFYDKRYSFHLSPREKQDLENFLRVL